MQVPRGRRPGNHGQDVARSLRQNGDTCCGPRVCKPIAVHVRRHEEGNEPAVGVQPPVQTGRRVQGEEPDSRPDGCSGQTDGCGRGARPFKPCVGASISIQEPDSPRFKSEWGGGCPRGRFADQGREELCGCAQSRSAGGSPRPPGFPPPAHAPQAGHGNGARAASVGNFRSWFVPVALS